MANGKSRYRTGSNTKTKKSQYTLLRFGWMGGGPRMLLTPFCQSVAIFSRGLTIERAGTGNCFISACGPPWQSLCHPAMRERHWRELMERIGPQGRPGERSGVCRPVPLLRCLVGRCVRRSASPFTVGQEMRSHVRFGGYSCQQLRFGGYLRRVPMARGVARKNEPPGGGFLGIPENKNHSPPRS